LNGEKEKNIYTDRFAKGITQESCLRYVDRVDLSEDKYGGYPISGQMKSCEYFYIYTLHFSSLWTYGSV